MAAGPRGWLLDTNVVSEIRKGARANAGVRTWTETVPPIACFLSTVSVAEILMGIERDDDLGFRGELDAWLRNSVLIWFGERILAADEAVLLAWRRLIAEGQEAH